MYYSWIKSQISKSDFGGMCTVRPVGYPFLYSRFYSIIFSKLNVTEIFRNMRDMQILIQCIDDSHIFLFNIKIKNIAIAPDSFRIDRFRNYGDSLLDSPAKSDLCRSSCVFCSKDTHHVIVKISSSCQWRVSLYLDTKSFIKF